MSAPSAAGTKLHSQVRQSIQQNSQHNLTPRVELHDLRLDAQLLEQSLDARAVRAVGLGEHEHFLLSDGGLHRKRQ